MDPGLAKPVVVIVTPAWAEANNGNWRTAQRWAQHLAAKHTVVLMDVWPAGRAQRFGSQASARSEEQASALALRARAMIALHARRSQASIEAWHRQRGARGLAVVLTGTDLYRDLPGDDGPAAHAVQRSLEAAQAVVVLQDHALQDLPADHRHKAQVIFQSATTRRTLLKSDPLRHALRAVMVGHLREEKDPSTLQQAARLIDAGAALADTPPIRIAHLGAALDPRFEFEARATEAAAPHYRWLGACTHRQTRERIQRAHVLVHTSRSEGGAHVIMEAVCSGTPVLASRMAGNLGMLGGDYAGYFEVGDAAGLAAALRRFQCDAEFRATLHRQCAERAGLFTPAAEAKAVDTLVATLLGAAG
jgi:putative glycosyltransferase (TIGR04348 family)